MNDQDATPAGQDFQVDLTNCDREPIHNLGRVQSFGALMSVSSDWIINHASENIDAFIGQKAEAIIGLPITRVLLDSATHDIRTQLQLLFGSDAVGRLFGVRLTKTEDLYDVAVHLSGRSIVIEFERSLSGQREDYISYVRPMIDRLGEAKTSQQLCDTAARQLKALIGFDRVMVYRFEKDESGTVVSEACKAGMEPFKGLRYPATDIPKQARALYKRNILRIVSDVYDEGAEIIPPRNPEGVPLDLSLSTTRAVSPIHIEYLKNMGVSASMSVSIIIRGRLWGLFSCHHETTKILPYSVRTAAELFGQLFSFVLDQKETDLAQEDRVRAQLLHDQIMGRLAQGGSIASNFPTIADAIGSVIPYDGIAGWIDGEFITQGRTPTRDQFIELVRFLNTTAVGSVYTTEALSQVYKPAADFVDRASGLLALPVSRMPRDYIVLFRREVAQSVIWAGNPSKPVEPGPNGLRLTPRKSFEAWKETVRGTCQSWSQSEETAAEALRVTLIEVVLRMSDQALKDSAHHSEKQELLIAELNHRVRNILNLIRSLVTQSQDESHTVADFTRIVSGRIHALARAHDQITQKNWESASLYVLINTEAEAYLADKAPRILLQGPDVLLKPSAFATLSLVIHELMTNSVKYGGLSSASGQVEITFSLCNDESMVILWCESGGPPISKPPARRGFGSTIIERSIPFELKGEAKLTFDVSGLRARFVVPAKHFSVATATDSPNPKQPVTKKTVTEPTLNGAALLVEDNMIIALDAEEALRELGAAKVYVANSVSEAMAFLDSETIAFALLDLNLGAETSEPIARRLAEISVPFSFATGYGELDALRERFPNATFVQKPYNKTDIAGVLPG